MKTPTSSVIALGSKIFKSSLFRAAGTYGFFSLLNKVIPFLLLPVMTRYLTPEDYGFVAVFGVMVTIATPFIGFSTHGAYSRAYFAPERFDSAMYLGTVIFFVLTTGLAMQSFFYVFRDVLSGVFSFPEAWLWIVPIVAISSVFRQITLVSWQVREKPRPYGLFQNGQTLCEVTGALFFVVLMGMGWRAGAR